MLSGQRGNIQEDKERAPQMATSRRVNAGVSVSALSTPERWDWSGTTSASSDQTYLTTLDSPLGLRSSQSEKRPRWWNFGRGTVEDIEMGAGIPETEDITVPPLRAAGTTQEIPMVDILSATDPEFALHDFPSIPEQSSTLAPPGAPQGITRSATLGTRVLNGRGGRVPERAASMRVEGVVVTVE